MASIEQNNYGSIGTKPLAPALYGGMNPDLRIISPNLLGLGRTFSDFAVTSLRGCLRGDRQFQTPQTVRPTNFSVK